MESSPERKADFDAAAEKVRRYRAGIKYEVERGIVDALTPYRRAMFDIDELLESLGIYHNRSEITQKVIPLPPANDEAMSDWLSQLRLAPLRLLDLEVPPVDQPEMSDRYMSQLFLSALDQHEPHDEGCLMMDDDSRECVHARICPMREVRRISLRGLQVLYMTKVAYKSVPQSEEYKAIDHRIGLVFANLTHYGIYHDDDLDELHVGLAENAVNFFASFGAE